MILKINWAASCLDKVINYLISYGNRVDNRNKTSPYSCQYLPNKETKCPIPITLTSYLNFKATHFLIKEKMFLMQQANYYIHQNEPLIFTI